ncbi:MAG: MaoC/PaaZ C-terminal domain-containing protein [Pseudomonadota bacterium]|nr:MaoC/PaaZ C-terminal domain-containing protein [Pseudomonadota bacterium]
MSNNDKLAVRDLSIEELSPGMFASFDTLLGRSKVDGFASLTGDISPIHVDPAYGEGLPYGGNIVHGMLTAGYFSTLVGVLLPGRRALLSSLSVDFREPIPVGSMVTITCRIVSINVSASTLKLNLIALHEGQICARGQAIVKVRP